MNMENTAFLSSKPASNFSRQLYLLKLCGVAALYALFAKVVLALFSANGVVSIVWPPSGLAMAVLLIGGKRYSPGVFLGALIANVMTGLHPGIAAAIAVGNTLEAFLGTWLLTRDYKFNPKIQTLNDYLRLLFLGGFIACSVAAINGSTILLLSGFITSEAYLPNLINWWMGDILGIILIATLILAWQRRPDYRLKPKRLFEAVLLLGLTFLAGQIIFLGWFHETSGIFEEIAKGYWIFLFIVLVAVRLGTNGVLIVMIIATVQSLLSAAWGVGFFANDIARTHLVNLWFYIVVLSVVGMAVSTYFQGLRHSEKELKDSNEDLQRLLDSMAEGAYGVDTNGNCTFVNKSFLHMLGYQDLNEILGRNIHDIIHYSHADGRPYPGSECKIYQSFKACQPVNVSDEVFWSKDGAAIPVEYWSHPIVKDGIVMGVINTFIDITERKQKALELKRSEERFETIFRESPLGIALIDSLTGIFLLVNPMYAKIAGRTMQKMCGSTWMSITYQDDVQKDLDNMKLLNAGEITGFQMEKRYIKPDGTVIWVNLTVAPVTVEDKSQPLHLAMIQDITEEKQNIEKLKRSNADLEQFAYAAAHDMRQPLRMILSYLQLLEEELKPLLTDTMRQDFNFAVDGARRMDQMLAALLDYSTTGRMSEAMAVINTGEALKEALQYLKPALEEAEADVIVKGKGAWPGLLANRREIVSLFQNLIENALKYRLEGRKPQIFVSVQEDGNEWRFAVSDNGIGLIPGQEKRLFKVFERLQARSRYSGTGIGLALCRKIVENHGGRIWVESPGENQGCTFIFTMPQKMEEGV